MKEKGREEVELREMLRYVGGAARCGVIYLFRVAAGWREVEGR